MQSARVERRRHANGVGHRPEGRQQGRRREKLLSEAGLGNVKVEIVKAEYGAGATQKDVTDVLRKQLADVQLMLTADDYNASFGGDPVPGTEADNSISHQRQARRSHLRRKRPHYPADAGIGIRKAELHQCGTRERARKAGNSKG